MGQVWDSGPPDTVTILSLMGDPELIPIGAGTESYMFIYHSSGRVYGSLIAAHLKRLNKQ